MHHYMLLSALDCSELSNVPRLILACMCIVHRCLSLCKQIHGLKSNCLSVSVCLPLKYHGARGIMKVVSSTGIDMQFSIKLYLHVGLEHATCWLAMQGGWCKQIGINFQAKYKNCLQSISADWHETPYLFCWAAESIVLLGIETL